MTENDPKQIRRLNFLLRFSFFATGIATVLIGQVLPILARRIELNDAQAGYFFISQFAGSLAGTFASSSFGRRSGFVPATVLGCFLIAAGVLFLNFDSFSMCLAGFFLNGLGIGLTLPSINMLTLELNPAKAASTLNVLNFFWGVGAIASQPFIDFFSRETSVLIPTAILAIVLAAIGAILALAPRGLERNLDQRRAEADEDLPEQPIWTHPTAWLIAFFNFVHVGFESGMGGWLKTYTERIEGERTVSFFPPIFLFFLLFVAGRGVAPLFLRFLDENKMLLLGLLIVLCGMMLTLFAGDLWLLSCGASIAGFGTSWIFPTNVSRFTRTFGPTATRRATPLFLCGTLGAAFTTWLIGFTSERFNDLRSGMFVLLASVALLVFLQIFLMFRRKPR